MTNSGVRKLVCRASSRMTQLCDLGEVSDFSEPQFPLKMAMRSSCVLFFAPVVRGSNELTYVKEHTLFHTQSLYTV